MRTEEWTVRTWLWMVAIGVVLWLGHASAQALSAPVLDVFDVTGARVVSTTVQAWVSWDRPGQTGAVCARVRAEFVGLGQKKAPAFACGPHTRWTLSRREQIQVTFARTPQGVRYALVTVHRQGAGRRLGRDQRRIGQALKPWGPVHVAVTVMGWRRAVDSRRQAYRVMSQALAAIGASPHFQYRRGRVWSLGGWSPAVTETGHWEGRRINIQVVVAAPSHGRSFVMVGSPLVMQRY